MTNKSGYSVIIHVKLRGTTSATEARRPLDEVACGLMLECFSNVRAKLIRRKLTRTTMRFTHLDEMVEALQIIRNI